MKNFILFLLGVTITIIANWPSIIKTYFPLNLPFCLIGGLLFDWYGTKLIIKGASK